MHWMESWGGLQVSILISKYLILFDFFRQSRDPIPNTQSFKGCRRLGQSASMMPDNIYTYDLFLQQGPRAQIDRNLYKCSIQSILHSYIKLDIMAGSVFDLVLDQSTARPGSWANVIGVRLGECLSVTGCLLINQDVDIRNRRSHSLFPDCHLHRNVLRRRNTRRHVLMFFRQS